MMAVAYLPIFVPWVGLIALFGTALAVLLIAVTSVRVGRRGSALVVALALAGLLASAAPGVVIYDYCHSVEKHSAEWWAFGCWLY